MVCSLIWLKGPNTLLQAVVGFGLVIPSVAGSHLLLNLRDAYYHPSGSRGVTTANTTGWTASTNVKKGTPTFGRSHDILASGGRHQVAQLDTQWALDPEQDDVTTFHVDPNASSKLDESQETDAAECETLPTGSQRGASAAKASGASTIMTTATISTFDDPAHPRPMNGDRRSSDANGVGDAYVYSTRQLAHGGAGHAAAQSGYDLENARGITSSEARRHQGESYELQNVRAGTTSTATHVYSTTTTAVDMHDTLPR